MRSPRSIWIARLIITGFAPYGSLERVSAARYAMCPHREEARYAVSGREPVAGNR